MYPFVGHDIEAQNETHRRRPDRAGWVRAHGEELVRLSPAGVHPDVAEARLLFECLDLKISAPVPEQENAEYGAFVSSVGRGSVRFRVGKLTPAKVGLFVTVWRRAEDGSTEPLAAEDGIDLLVVTAREGKCFGQFVFPKTVLVEHGIVSVEGRGGKRGFRVYPPWSATGNRQARRSQKWQCEYFLELDGRERVDVHRAQQLYDRVYPTS
ncbi:MepB family protein [Nocardia cyriacigeorgica]|uniref:MepB family protein n=1 Tax=Nocardia cyriacigeorgica TaxID=135487 RepID=A0ABX0CHZ5_9NOCA|nr:MepB family protein [Nocardia cyriacigeorgica]NEW56168.1 MepB family protein [Nocardia cyriacigeorgica]